MYLKAEFRRRLENLSEHILDVLDHDDHGDLNGSRGLFSALFSVIKFIQCKNPKDLFKH